MNTDDVAKVMRLLTIPGAHDGRNGEIRVDLKRWRGRESLDVRWWAARAGEHRATMRGASIPLHCLEAFAAAVLEAVRRVKAGGWPTP